MIPKGLKYLEIHEWAGREGVSDIITVGITDYAVEQLGDIVFLELPAVGDKLAKDSELCTIESVKVASALYAPVSGHVVEINEDLVENLDLFKSDPYGQAWVVKIKADDMSEFESLMTAENYEELLKG